MIEKNAKLQWRRIYWNGKGYDMTKEMLVDADEMQPIEKALQRQNERTQRLTMEMLTMETDEIATEKTPTIEIQTLHDERRDLFAAAALTGLLSAVDAGEAWVSHCAAAEDSFRYADAMIEASKK